MPNERSSPWGSPANCNPRLGRENATRACGVYQWQRYNVCFREVELARYRLHDCSQSARIRQYGKRMPTNSDRKYIGTYKNESAHLRDFLNDFTTSCFCGPSISSAKIQHLCLLLYHLIACSSCSFSRVYRLGAEADRHRVLRLSIPRVSGGGKTVAGRLQGTAWKECFPWDHGVGVYLLPVVGFRPALFTGYTRVEFAPPVRTAHTPGPPFFNRPGPAIKWP